MGDALELTHGAHAGELETSVRLHLTGAELHPQAGQGPGRPSERARMARVLIALAVRTGRQEEHRGDLATRFDQYVGHLKAQFGEIGDLRITVMAGIMVMDELTELQKRVKGMESEIMTLRKTRDDALIKADKNDAALSGALSALAQRMEDLALKLQVQKG